MMAFAHGKNVGFMVNSVDLSDFTNSVEPEREADSHDVTTYGNNNGAHRYQGGLTDGSVSASGIFDNATAGPKSTLEPLLGTVVPLVYRPDGVGTGKIEQTFSGLLTSYSESAPVAEMVTWECEFQIDGAVTTGTQA